MTLRKGILSPLDMKLVIGCVPCLSIRGRTAQKPYAFTIAAKDLGRVSGSKNLENIIYFEVVQHSLGSEMSSDISPLNSWTSPVEFDRLMSHFCTSYTRIY